MADAGCTCKRCSTDRSFLTTSERPALPGGRRRALRAVDLFAGCGGMTRGLEEAARRAGRKLDVVLAIELEALIGAVYEANFPKARMATGDVASVFDGELGAPNTLAEQVARYATGDVDVLVAGPPCQRHSDLNNHTRREDPKNALYARVARAAEVLRPRLVVIENVPPVQWDKGGVVDKDRRVADLVARRPRSEKEGLMRAVVFSEWQTGGPCTVHAPRAFEAFREFADK